MKQIETVAIDRPVNLSTTGPELTHASNAKRNNLSDRAWTRLVNRSDNGRKILSIRILLATGSRQLLVPGSAWNHPPEAPPPRHDEEAEPLTCSFQAEGGAWNEAAEHGMR
jgi:hypothetical protein